MPAPTAPIAGPSLKPYAELPGRRARQLAADLGTLAWLAVLVVIGTSVRELVLGLRGPAAGLVAAGGTIGDAFAAAAGTAAVVPFFGAELAAGLERGRAAGESLAAAGRQQYETITSLAGWSLLLVVLPGALPVLAVWLPTRLRYARAAAAAVACRDRDAELLALRALIGAPLDTLRTVSPDPAAAYRQGEPAAVAALAALELTRLGLRPPNP